MMAWLKSSTTKKKLDGENMGNLSFLVMQLMLADVKTMAKDICFQGERASGAAPCLESIR